MVDCNILWKGRACKARAKSGGARAKRREMRKAKKSEERLEKDEDDKEGASV